MATMATMAMNALNNTFLLQLIENHGVDALEDNSRSFLGIIPRLFSLSVDGVSSCQKQLLQDLPVTYAGCAVKERPAIVGVVRRPVLYLFPAIDRLDDRGDVFSRIRFDRHTEGL
jgi:hypothetical protein